MNYKMYGIPNCNTVKKARIFLEKNKINYEFVDFKKNKPTEQDIKRWEKSFGSLPVNKKGHTFRKIKETFDSAIASQQIQLLIENSSAIKRPILEKSGKVIAFGFDENVYKKI